MIVVYRPVVTCSVAIQIISLVTQIGAASVTSVNILPLCELHESRT